MTNNGSSSGCAGIGANGGGNPLGPILNMPDIPTVSEPDYPERVPGKQLGAALFNRTQGTNERSKLAVAPQLDVSSSGADDVLINFMSCRFIYIIFHLLMRNIFESMG